MEGKHFTLLLAAVIVLVLLLAAALALLGWLLLKLHRENDATPTQKTNKKNKKKLEPGSHCPEHPDKPTSGKCALCEKNFCDECLFSPDGPSFCREHVGVYLGTTWAELGEIKTTPTTPYTAEHLYKTKRELLEGGEIPSFILTNYKINTEIDSIESYVCLCVPQEKKETVMERIRKNTEAQGQSI